MGCRHDHTGTGRIYRVFLLVRGCWDAWSHGSSACVGSNLMQAGIVYPHVEHTSRRESRWEQTPRAKEEALFHRLSI